MTIYIDSDYKCYVSDAEGRRAVETDFFDGKCPEWIESFRFVPADETWTRGDGEVFKWRDGGSVERLEQRIRSAGRLSGTAEQTV